MNSSVFSHMGTLALLDSSRKHRERLLGSDVAPASDLAAELTARESALQTAYNKRRPLQAVYGEATAEKNEADARVERHLVETSYDLLSPGVYNRNRQHPGYRALFPDGRLEFIHGPDGEQVSQVDAIVAYLESHPEHPAAGKASTLRAANAELRERLAASSAAAMALRGALNEERGAREALRKQLRRNLQILRAELEGDEARVDALFAPIPAPRSSEEDDEPADLPPA
jgi:glutathione S-transferase